MNMEEIKIIYAQASRWVLPFLIVLLAVCVFTCNHERDENGDLNSQLRASLQRTQQLENRNGELVAQNTVIFTNNKKELKALTDSVFNLKDRESKLIAAVDNYAQIIQEVRFSVKNAAFNNKPVIIKGDTVKIEQPADPDLVRVPRSFDYADSSLSFSGTVYKTHVSIDSLAIPNILSIRTVENKSGFLHLGRTTAVQALNSNPAFKNAQIASIQVRHKATQWQRWIKPAIFAGLGIITGKQLTK